MTYKVPYFPTLRRVRSFLEQQDTVKTGATFPKLWCKETSLLVHRFTGLSVIGGRYWTRGEPEDHFWNYDPERELYIDLTHDQFGESRRKIVIIPESPSPMKKELVCTSFEMELIWTVDELQKLYVGWKG